MIKNFYLTILTIVLTFICLDFVYSNYKNSKLTQLIEYDKIFEYNFKKNLSAKTKFGPFLINFCTNNMGMRVKCGDKSNLKKYDLALIGDSFVEGVGLNYEESINGLIENKKNINTANLGVRSYSPINYLKKLIFFIEKGYEFEHIIIFIDISDIQDEFFRLGKIKDNFKNIKIQNNKNFYSLLTSNLQMSYYLYFKIKSFIRNNLNYSGNMKIFENLDSYSKDYDRGSWTYDETNKYRDVGIEFATKNMKLLVDYLNEKKIKYSLAIYPWPQQIIYDAKDSFKVKHWSKFCKINNCQYFYNFFDDYFELVEKNSLKFVLLNYYFYTDVHFNKNGNNIIAEKIIRDIK